MEKIGIEELRKKFWKNFKTMRQGYESLREAGFSYAQIGKIGGVSERTAWERINDKIYTQKFPSRRLTKKEMELAIKIAGVQRGK